MNGLLFDGPRKLSETRYAKAFCPILQPFQFKLYLINRCIVIETIITDQKSAGNDLLT